MISFLQAPPACGIQPTSDAAKQTTNILTAIYGLHCFIALCYFINVLFNVAVEVNLLRAEGVFIGGAEHVQNVFFFSIPKPLNTFGSGYGRFILLPNGQTGIY